MDQEEKVEYVIKPHRGMAKRTYEFFNVQTKVVNGQDVSCGFPYSEEAFKIKNLKDKGDQKCVGQFRNAKPFGFHLFDKGSKDGIILTEGEEDAMAAFEMMHGRYAVLSLKSGATSTRDFSQREVYEHIDSFPKIYICFDNDEPGKNATRAVAGLFDFRKTFRVELSKYKDANDYLLNNEAPEFKRTLEASKRYAPDNIISSFDDVAKALEEGTEEMLAEYPFPELQARTFGMHETEVVVVKAAEGVGKTEFLRAVEYHILQTTKHPIGIIHLEESNGTTVKALAGYALDRPATLPESYSGLSKQDILEGYKKAVRDDEGRVHIHSSFDVENEDAFFGTIRFLVVVAGCRIIALDHITWLATGQDEDEDERRKLDRISQRLKLMAKELKFCLLEVSHINDDGKTRGSRNISKVANTVLYLQRDTAAGQNVTGFVLEKVRMGGRSGPAGHAYFNVDTGKLDKDPPPPRLEDDE